MCLLASPTAEDTPTASADYHPYHDLQVLALLAAAPLSPEREQFARRRAIILREQTRPLPQAH